MTLIILGLIFGACIIGAGIASWIIRKNSYDHFTDRMLWFPSLGKSVHITDYNPINKVVTVTDLAEAPGTNDELVIL